MKPVFAKGILAAVAFAMLAVFGPSGCRPSGEDDSEPRTSEAGRTANQASGPATADAPGRSGGRRQHPLAPARRSSGPAPKTLLRFVDSTDDSGITFVHTDGSSGRHFIVEAMSTGLATFDYDNDGLVDIYFPNGAPLPGTKTDRPPRPALYRNLGNWRFRDVTEASGIQCTAFGLGATAADYDNDGWPDLFLSNFGPKVLYRNNGRGAFIDVTGEAGVGDGNRFGAGACFLDADGDGLLDLFVANYVKFSFDGHVPHTMRGFPVYPGPLDYAPESHALYRNLGNGKFQDISAASGIASHPSPGMGAVCVDYDGDGATDIFVCSDGRENLLFRNDGRGKFEELGLMAGVACNAGGQPHANMGVDCGDYDGDGRLDFYVTSYQNEWAELYRNLGGGLFADVTEESGAGDGTFPYVTWGCGFVDFDNDGRRDLFVGCGHLEDNIDLWDDTTAYRCTNVLLLNSGGKFVNASDVCGLASLAPHSARGTAFEDLDNDGDVDVVIVNSRERPTLLRNMYRESGGKNHWIDLRLVGAKSNRDAVGARVRVVAGDLTSVDEIHSGRGYQSHWGSRLHFGLGERTRVDRIEVRWSGGGVDVFEDPPCDKLVTLKQR